MISIKTGSLIWWLGFYWSIGLCQFYGIIYVCESTLMVTSDAIENESHLEQFGISFRTIKKIPRNVLCFPYCSILCEASLQWSSNLTGINKFCGIMSKIPCIAENVITWKTSLRIRYDSYIGILRPFGTISEVFEKSSAEISVIPCFPESVFGLILPVYIYLWLWSSDSKPKLTCTVSATLCWLL